MINLTANFLKNKTKIGFLVTILVLGSACSHDIIKSDVETAAAIPTPEPIEEPLTNEPSDTPKNAMSDTSATQSLPPQKIAKSITHHARKHHRHSKATGHIASRKHKTTTSAKLAAHKKALPKQVASVASVKTFNDDPNNILPPPPPAPEAQPPNLQSLERTQPQAQPTDSSSLLGNILGVWPYALFAVGFAATVFFVTRKERTKRRGGRGLLFNT